MSSVFKLAAYFPPKYKGAVMLGTGAGSILFNLLRGVCLLAIPPEKEFINAIVYFAVSSIIMVISSLTHIMFQQMSFVQYYILPDRKKWKGECLNQKEYLS